MVDSFGLIVKERADSRRLAAPVSALLVTAILIPRTRIGVTSNAIKNRTHFPRVKCFPGSAHAFFSTFNLQPALANWPNQLTVPCPQPVS
jgi:hypothetical protein